MQRIFTTGLLTAFFVMALALTGVDAQGVSVSGIVTDKSTGDPLMGVNVVVKGKVIGTITGADGRFSLNVDGGYPLTLVFSYVGYQSEEQEVTAGNASNIVVSLNDQIILGKEIVVSASRTEESIMKSPVSIEKMSISDIRNTPSDDYYKAIANLRGVDVSSSSINFQILNTRGFGSTGNVRFVQLTDMMDTQAPALNFPIGNLNGPSMLDVESVELIPGAASAMYGANAYNGILLVTSKNPFEYQGLSAYAKYGMNHFGANVEGGAPSSPQPMYEASIRYATAISNKFAFKVNLSYMKAEDWYGTDYSDKNRANQGNLSINPSYDAVHRFGDDGGINLGLLRGSQAFIGGFAQALQSNFGMDEETSLQQAALYAGSLPADNVNRTGYEERHLVDYGAENLKAGLGLNYRITNNLEASYTLNYGYGTSVYTGAQRYSLNNFSIQQHKLELKSSSYVLRGYATIENSGDSYIADFTGYAINNAYINNTNWFGTYAGAYAQQMLTRVLLATGSPMYDAGIVGGLNNPVDRSNFHSIARNTADGERYTPGSVAFNQAKDSINNGVIPNGAKFDDGTRFYQVDGQYNFKEQIDAFELLVGGQWRRFDLRSNGTIFPDNEPGGIQFGEYGAYVQVGKSIFNDKLKLQGSVRYDKSKNFDGQFSPRISGVFSINDDHAIRTSYQTGFRNPTTQAQYIDLNVITSRLLGGLPRFAEQYDILNNTYNIFSVLDFTRAFIENPTDPSNFALLQPFTADFWKPVKPERIQVFEIGYRGVIDQKLMIDLNYYRNIYNDFITQIQFRRSVNYIRDGQNNITGTVPVDLTDQTLDPAVRSEAVASLLNGDFWNTYSIYTNVNQTVYSQGAAVGVDYLLPKGYKLSGNYSWNKLDESSLPDDYLNDYNTPEHIVNLSFGNRKAYKNLGFNMAWRYQTEFEWQASFGIGTVPAYNTLDLQLSYTVPSIKSIIKVGGSNVMNNYYTANFGSPAIGSIYYVSLMFDEMLR